MTTNLHSTLHLAPGGTLTGKLQVPGDKSISHRALILGAIAEGESEVSGYQEGEDTLATMEILGSLGVDIEKPGPQQAFITGKGLHGLQAPKVALDCGNSGTSVRLLTGLLAGQEFDCELIGDKSLMKRPMLRVVEPLRKMGAEITTSEQGTLPIHIHGGRTLNGIEYTLPVASAQLKSCLILAGIYAGGKTVIHEPEPTRDHTERMLLEFGYPLEKEETSITVQGGKPLTATRIVVPADLSSAAFFIVGASIARGSDITLLNVGINPTRSAIIPLLQKMGADITVHNERVVSGEPVADIRVRSSDLCGIEIPDDMVPIAIDELPVLMIAAACAKGETLLRGAAELRVKESDRISAMVAGLETLGVVVESFEDGMRVVGGRITGGTIDSYGDHRIAMSFAMAALVAESDINIRDCANINTSFPGFVESAIEAGMNIDLYS